MTTRIGRRTTLKNPPIQADSAWKDVIDAYFPEFMNFFYPTLAEKINWAAGYEALDKELQTLSSKSKIGKRYVDKLMRMQLLKSKLLAHIEVQGMGIPEFNRRLFEYYYRIYDRCEQPIITLVILADDNPNWRPNCYQANVEGIDVLTFQFLPIKLLDYQTQTNMLENTTNPFGIIVLAHLAGLKTRKDPKARFDSKLNLTRRLYERNLGKEDILTLYKFIDWVMPLPEALEVRYNETIQKLEEEHTMSYITSAERIGIKKGIQEGMQLGIQQGMQKGERLFLLQQLIYKFGKVPDIYRQCLKLADEKTLLLWGKRLLKASLIEEVFDN
ncbi:MAG: hypothetical protein WBE18_05640 [Gammaproteobacteria bacterium]